MATAKWACGCRVFGNVNYKHYHYNDCPACQQGDALRSAREAKEEDTWLPELSGSPKQINWAYRILREFRIAELNRMELKNGPYSNQNDVDFAKESLAMFIDSLKSAAIVIDMRESVRGAFSSFNSKRSREEQEEKSRQFWIARNNKTAA